MEHAYELLKKTGFKITPQRKALLVLFQKECTPKTAEEIIRVMKNKMDKVTVYRNIKVLEDAGVVRQVYGLGKSSMYESALHHHHHVTCTQCGFLESFDGCLVDKLFSGEKMGCLGFSTITSHSFELFGLCKKCARV